MRDALPLLRAAQRVSLVEVGRGAEPTPTATIARRRPSAWLESHGVAVEAHREIGARRRRRPAAVARRRSRRDLIVCGGYGHSRLREWVLGGITRHLLEHMTVPTLFSH